MMEYVGTQILSRMVSMRQRRSRRFREEKGLRVVMVGTGSPLADPTRGGPCTVVIAGGEYLIVDVGQGGFAAQQAKLRDMNPGDVTGILLTHFHSDHICELGETLTMSWVPQARKEPLPVYGPPGVDRIVRGFNDAYEQDSNYRYEHHKQHGGFVKVGSRGKAVTIPIPGGSHDSLEKTLVMNTKSGLKVWAFNVDHKPVAPAFGYRFEYKGRVAVISGDTCMCKQLLEHTRGADVLVSEACSCHVVGTMCDTLKRDPESRIQRLGGVLSDVTDYHIDVQDAVDVAAKCNVPVLAMTHLVPPTRGIWLMERLFLSRLKRPAGWTGKMSLGRDGDTYRLPPSPSKAIEMENLCTPKFAILIKFVPFIFVALLSSWLTLLFMRDG